MANKIPYTQPFEKGDLSSQRFRIPALYTLCDGSVLAGADVRYDHGSDSPNNIDIAVAVSADGYTGWQQQIVNRFDDYADGVTDRDSASFIDSAVAQTANGRIFLICDVFPAQGGYLQAKKGSGFCVIDGKKRLLLSDRSHSDRLADFGYYIGETADGFAPVLTRADGKKTGFSVDSEFRLYQDGEPLYCAQKGRDDVRVQQNVFYSASVFHVYRTVYLWMRTSDDGGRTWSAPRLLSDTLKHEDESFFGICPGRGTVFMHEGRERIVFCAYNNRGIIADPHFENACAVYSDDNGETWKRSEKIKIRPGLGKTSEAQTVVLQNGNRQVLRMYARNSSNFIAFSDSTDGGRSWTAFRADMALQGTRNCMVSFITANAPTLGGQAVLCSAGGSVTARADGILRVGVTQRDCSVRWISQYRINEGFFGYSCLTQLSDGLIALLYEDEPAHLRYMLLRLSPDGTLSEINGENCSCKETEPNGIKGCVFRIKKKAVALFAKK